MAITDSGVMIVLRGSGIEALRQRAQQQLPAIHQHKSISLNGSEIVAGGTIIIPSAISTLATTKSIIRNGINTVKPIWKAVFNSLVT